MVRDAVHQHNARQSTRAEACHAVIKADGGTACTTGHQHGSHVVQIGHHAGERQVTCHRPVGWVEPFTRRAAHPSDRVQTRHISRGAARARHQVVGGIGARQGHAVHADGFACGHVLVGKAGRAVDVKHIAAHAVVGGGHGGHGGAVIGAVHTGVAHRQVAQTDAARPCGTGGQGVVAQRGAVVGREVCISQRGRHAVGFQHVAAVVSAQRLGDGGAFGHTPHRHKTCEGVVGRDQRGIGVAVIGFLNAAGQRRRQSLGRDGGRCAAGAGHAVVGRIGAA